MSFFSIIIPLYNKENFVENTLKSVLNQRFSDFEVIIINDGSTDLSEEKVMRFRDPRIQYFYKKNEGVSVTRNLGIEKATSNFITFIDADDYWHPDFLEEMHNKIRQFPEINVFSAAIEVETPKNIIQSSYSIKKTGEYEIVDYFKASSQESVIWTSCAVFHKSVFEKTGVFDPKLKSTEDTDMWIRIGLTYPILFIWKILARYVYDKNSLSKNTALKNETIDFSRYIEQEKTNPNLKCFLDLNRFSMAIKSKLMGDQDQFKKYRKDIQFNNIGVKKSILLNLPPYILNKLIGFKVYLASIGLGNSVFK